MAAVGGRRYATWRYRGCAAFDRRDLACGDGAAANSPRPCH